MTIDVAEISWPLQLLRHLILFRTNVIIQVLHESMNLFAFTFDRVEAGSNSGIVDVLNIFGSLSPILPLEEWGLAPKLGD
jgi:hypothetical protein